MFGQKKKTVKLDAAFGLEQLVSFIFVQNHNEDQNVAHGARDHRSGEI